MYCVMTFFMDGNLPWSSDFIAFLKDLDGPAELDAASEFLVVAATLLDMKIVGLLPAGEYADAEDVAGRLREELVGRVSVAGVAIDEARLADLAYALNQWAEPGDPPGHRAVPPTSLPGFPSRQALADRYAQRTGRDLSNLAYYTAFNRWKSACILHGVYARYRAGQKSTDGVDLDAMRQTIGQTLGQAEAALG